MSERSFVMVKPDGVAAGLTGEIITRIERRGLEIVALRKTVLVRGDRRGALRRAPRAPLLRRAGRVHRLGSGGPDGRGGRGRHRAPCAR